MKRIIPYILLLGIIIGWAGCNSPASYPRAMQQAESLMNTHPDSALHLLQGMTDSISILPKEAQMYYHLLTIQAKDKQYITHTSDSLINRIVSFYEEYNDNDRLMMAYFYQGSTYRDMNDAPRALKAFHQAIDAGKDTENLTLLGQTYGQMGTLLAKHELYDEALEAHKKSLILYDKQEESLRIPLVLRNIARIYDIKETNDSAILFYNQALDMSIQNGSIKSSNNIMSELGCLYYELGEKKKAKQILDQLKGHPSTICNALLFLGIIHKEQNQIDSAYYFFNQVLIFGDLDKQCSAYKYLCQIEKHFGNEQKSQIYKEQYLLLHDSISNLKQKEKTGNIHLTFNYKRIKKDNESLYKERTFFRTHLIATWTFILSIIAILTGWIFFVKRKKEKRLHGMIEQNPIFNTEIFLFFKKASRNECIASENEWLELQTQIRNNLPEYYTRLSEKKLIFNLTLHEVKICHLTKLKFTNRAMANVLHVTESAISHAKTRLYQRIMKKKGTSAKFFDFIEDL